MSELKRFDIVGKYADEEVMYEFRPDGECYDADEVDKLIAEKDLEIKKLEKCKQWMKGHFFCEEIASVKVRHQKYKRCLAMAKWCNERWILDECLYELGKTRFYERWENRWLKIAEQFKEAK